MPLTVAIQMDPIERIDIDADSTFALALEELAAAANAQFGAAGPSPDPKARAEQIRRLGTAAEQAFAALEERFFAGDLGIDELLERWLERLQHAA